MIPNIAKAERRQPIFIQIPEYAFSFSIKKSPNLCDSGEIELFTSFSHMGA